MALKPGRRTSLRLDLPQGAPLESPPGIAALFLIRFDIKKGCVLPRYMLQLSIANTEC
jgi:hypothetical protein